MESGWNVWVWLAGGGCSKWEWVESMGVVSRRWVWVESMSGSVVVMRYIGFLILLIPIYILCSFCKASLLFFVHKIMFFHSCLCYFCAIL